jgi:hypothetical protein
LLAIRRWPHLIRNGLVAGEVEEREVAPVGVVEVAGLVVVEEEQVEVVAQVAVLVARVVVERAAPGARAEPVVPVAAVRVERVEPAAPEVLAHAEAVIFRTPI